MSTERQSGSDCHTDAVESFVGGDGSIAGPQPRGCCDSGTVARRPPPLTPQQRAQAEAMLGLFAEAGARPVVSPHGGVVLHAAWDPPARRSTRPWCRRPVRTKRRMRLGNGGGHDGWREASLRELATFRTCSECRPHLALVLDGGMTAEETARRMTWGGRT